MQSANQHGKSLRSQIIMIALRALLILFGVATVSGYGYGVFDHFKTNGAVFEIVVLSPVVISIPFALGWLINKEHPGHMIALLFLVMAYTMGAANISYGIHLLNEAHPGRYANQIDASTLTIGHIVWMPSVIFPLFMMPLYFPSGKLLSPRWRLPVIIALGSMAWMAISIIFHPWPWLSNDIPDTRTPNGIPGSEQFFETTGDITGCLLMLAFLLVPVAFFLRYRRAQGTERVQMKYPLAVIVFYFLSIPIFVGVPSLSDFDAELGYPITWTIALLFPLSIGVAILQYRLFDIDIIINRTLVYGILTAFVILLYVIIISGLGSIIQAQTSVVSGLVATGVVAVIFQPLRDRLQRIVNHILYGERDEPALVLSRIAYHLETADTPAAILPNLVQTIAYALKIPYVAIWLPTVNDDNVEIAADWGTPSEQREMISLIYQNRTIGYLVVAPRGINERFTTSERTLLTTIAALTATTVRAVKLSDELRQSRQRIVTAREEERRRIRRDLHDGLGPQLASQTLGLEAVTHLMPTNPQKALSLLKSLQAQAHEAIQDVRRLIYDLRPPALDDLGLIGALKQSASRYETAYLHFNFEITDIRANLPAAVETAAYRIIQEAMTNVVRHAQAAHCNVRLHCTNSEMIVEIEDDGCGLPEKHSSGIGLQTMSERAAELNGETTINRSSDKGTLVQARLPLGIDHE